MPMSLKRWTTAIKELVFRTEYNENMTSIEQSINNQETSIDNHSTQISDLQTTVSNHTSSINNLQEEVSNIVLAGKAVVPITAANVRGQVDVTITKSIPNMIISLTQEGGGVDAFISALVLSNTSFRVYAKRSTVADLTVHWMVIKKTQ